MSILTKQAIFAPLVDVRFLLASNISVVWDELEPEHSAIFIYQPEFDSTIFLINESLRSEGCLGELARTWHWLCWIHEERQRDCQPVSAYNEVRLPV